MPLGRVSPEIDERAGDDDREDGEGHGEADDQRDTVLAPRHVDPAPPGQHEGVTPAHLGVHLLPVGEVARRVVHLHAARVAGHFHVQAEILVLAVFVDQLFGMDFDKVTSVIISSLK